MNIIMIYYDYKDMSEHRWAGRGHMFRLILKGHVKIAWWLLKTVNRKGWAAFAVASPELWNHLRLSIRCSVVTFRVKAATEEKEESITTKRRSSLTLKINLSQAFGRTDGL